VLAEQARNKEKEIKEEILYNIKDTEQMSRMLCFYNILVPFIEFRDIAFRFVPFNFVASSLFLFVFFHFYCFLFVSFRLFSFHFV
jgi:hypothetical protein